MKQIERLDNLSYARVGYKWAYITINWIDGKKRYKMAKDDFNELYYNLLPEHMDFCCFFNYMVLDNRKFYLYNTKNKKIV